VLDFAHLGSSLALRSFARLGSKVSVFDLTSLGSSLSLRSLARVGSSLSVIQCSRFGSSLAVFDFFQLGSSLSLRSFARLGSGVSVLQVHHLGASLSLRSIARLGSAMSVFAGATRLGSSLSVLDFAFLGSSLSLRSCARIGSTLSVLSFITCGSSLSVRSMVKLGSELSVSSIQFGSTSTYLHYDSGISGIAGYVGGTRAITWTASGANGGGTLHGTWVADGTITTSDRRIKTNIKPLLGGKFTGGLAEPAKQSSGKAKDLCLGCDLPSPSTGKEEEKSASNLQWMLRQLRPVSYNFRRGSDAKNIRFGFIAQEMENILPEVVRTMPGKKVEVEEIPHTNASSNSSTNETGESHSAGDSSSDGDDMKGIVYTDLIAVLTSVVKDFGATLQNMQERMRMAELELDRLDDEQPLTELI
jgi:hypothetical protein